jgi:hypothetical protein
MSLLFVALLKWSLLFSMENFRLNTVLLIVRLLVFFVLHRYSNLKKGVSKMTRTVDLELNNLAQQKSRQPHMHQRGVCKFKTQDNNFLSELTSIFGCIR